MIHARPSRRRIRRQLGVTLVEVLVGLVIFMIGALGMMGFVGKSIGSSVESRARAQTAMLAQEFYSRLDLAMTTAGRGGNLPTYRAALSAAAPVVFDAWRTQALDTAGGLAGADASYAVIEDSQSVHVQLTITWRIRGDTSAKGLEDAPVRSFVTSRPVI